MIPVCLDNSTDLNARIAVIKDKREARDKCQTGLDHFDAFFSASIEQYSKLRQEVILISKFNGLNLILPFKNAVYYPYQLLNFLANKMRVNL